jgi:hypothetical protein
MAAGASMLALGRPSASEGGREGWASDDRGRWWRGGRWAEAEAEAWRAAGGGRGTAGGVNGRTAMVASAV